MKRLHSLPLVIALSLGGCVAGPGGVNNTANRTIGGVAAGAALGGLAGAAIGSDPFGGAVAGAAVGGALGAAVNPRVFRRDTAGNCYYVDKDGNVVYDYERRC
jgi:uncharacterized protein YcfJ